MGGGRSTLARVRAGISSSPSPNPNPNQVPLRNQQPEAITTHGFVECTGLLPEALCARLADLSMDRAIGISNAFQQAPYTSYT